MSAGLSVAVRHRQGAFRLEAAFEAPAGVTALFGRSGSGKSTLVGIMGGLVRPREGRVALGDAVLLDTASGIDVKPHRRRIATVFQDARLFPHLNVRQNLLFGRWFAPRGEPGPELGAVAAMLGIEHLLGRRPRGLSGGERQRVAIGRALLAKPRLLVMDEPLASLDETRKAEILPFIERLRDEAAVPIVYVSHALAEVARLADTLVLVEGGRVVAAGPASDLLARVGLPGLSGARDAGAVLPASVVGHDVVYGLTRLDTPAGPLQVPRVDLPIGAGLRVQIFARDVMLSLVPPVGLSALNVLAGTVAEISPAAADGTGVAVRLDCGGRPLLARITAKSVAGLSLRPGTTVYAVVKSVAMDPRGASVRDERSDTGPSRPWLS